MRDISARQGYQLKSTKVYVSLLSFFIVTYALKLNHIPLPDFLIQHISNFSITGSLFLLSSVKMLRRSSFTKMRLLLEMSPFALLNIIMELFVDTDTIHFVGMSFAKFNTPDPIDMVFGVAALACIYFALMKHSLKVSPAGSSSPAL